MNTLSYAFTDLNPFVVSVQSQETVVTLVRTNTQFVFKIPSFSKHQTDSLWYNQKEGQCVVVYRQPLHLVVYHFKAKVIRCFPRVFESYDCSTKFDSLLGMDSDGKFYGCSAIKVELVDSLIQEHTTTV